MNIGKMGIATDKAFPRGGFSTNKKSESDQDTIKKVVKPKRDKELFSTEIVQDAKAKKKSFLHFLLRYNDALI